MDNLKCLKHLDVSILRGTLGNAINSGNIDIIKQLLSINKLDFEKDFVEVAKTTNNEQVLKYLDNYKKDIFDKVSDIILNKYQSFDFKSSDEERDLLLYDYESIFNNAELICVTYPALNCVSESYGQTKNQKNFNSYWYNIINGIFEGIEWSNMIIAGNFILSGMFGVPINDSTMDIYVYGNNKTIIKKYTEIIKHLEKFNPTFVVKQEIVTIVIPTINYNIRIIPSVKSPCEIINNFTFNYEKFYYDGKNVHTTIGGLIFFKYKLIKLNNIANRDNVDDKLSIMVNYGFHVQYNSQLKEISTIVTDYYIDNNKNVRGSKVWTTTKQMMNLVEREKHADIIKMMFKTDALVIDLEQTINKIGELEEPKNINQKLRVRLDEIQFIEDLKNIRTELVRDDYSILIEPYVNNNKVELCLKFNSRYHNYGSMNGNNTINIKYPNSVFDNLEEYIKMVIEKHNCAHSKIDVYRWSNYISVISKLANIQNKDLFIIIKLRKKIHNGDIFVEFSLEE